MLKRPRPPSPSLVQCTAAATAFPPPTCQIVSAARQQQLQSYRYCSQLLLLLLATSLKALAKVDKVLEMLRRQPHTAPLERRKQAEGRKAAVAAREAPHIQTAGVGQGRRAAEAAREDQSKQHEATEAV